MNMKRKTKTLLDMVLGLPEGFTLSCKKVDGELSLSIRVDTIQSVLQYEQKIAQYDIYKTFCKEYQEWILVTCLEQMIWKLKHKIEEGN